MRWLIIILFTVACHKDVSFNSSFYLHGGDFKAWGQEVRTKTENGNTQPMEPAKMNWIFYFDNTFFISTDMDRKPPMFWFLENDTLVITNLNGSSKYKVLSLKIDELALESYFSNIIYNQTWIPL